MQVNLLAGAGEFHSACQNCGHGIHAEDSEPRQVPRENLRVLPFVKRQDP